MVSFCHSFGNAIMATSMIDHVWPHHFQFNFFWWYLAGVFIPENSFFLFLVFSLIKFNSWLYLWVWNTKFLQSVQSRGETTSSKRDSDVAQTSPRPFPTSSKIFIYFTMQTCTSMISIAIVSLYFRLFTILTIKLVCFMHKFHWFLVELWKFNIFKSGYTV